MFDRFEPSSKFGNWLLKKLLYGEEYFEKSGDFEEVYQRVAESEGRFKARLWLWAQIIKSLPLFIVNTWSWSAGMSKNYFKVTLRTIWKYKSYSFINLSGLSIGIACVILLTLFITNELNYDTFHKKYDRIYRITTDYITPNNEYNLATSSIPLPLIKKLYNEVEESVHILDGQGTLVSKGEKIFYEDRFLFTSSDFFNIFDFELQRGDRDNVLTDKNSLILSAEAAKKYFNNEDPIGKILLISTSNLEEKPYHITGVLKELPPNTHFRFDFLAHIDIADQPEGKKLEEWLDLQNHFKYVVLSEKGSKQEFEDLLNALVTKNLKPWLERLGSNIEFKAQPLSEIHFNNLLNNDMVINFDMKNIYFFVTIGIVILLISCINFMNLSTAKSLTRSKEVGMRKVFGAMRSQLIKQFYGEAIMYTLIAMVIGVILVELSLPYFNAVTDRHLGLLQSQSRIIPVILGTIVLFVGLLAGSYPALYLSSFLPAQIFKNKTGSGSPNITLRNTLVITQFTTAIVLVAGTMIANSQLHFFKTKALGLDTEQIMVIPLGKGLQKDQVDSFKSELMRNPVITNVTVSSSTPGSNWAESEVFNEDGAPEDKRKLIMDNGIDHSFFDVYGLTIKRGVNFSPGKSSSESDEIIVNEALVRDFGWNNPIGKRLKPAASTGVLTVIGVINDYHHQSLQLDISPMIFRIRPANYTRVSVKLSGADLANTIAYVESVWKRFSPVFPIEYSFVDEAFDTAYSGEVKRTTVFSSFATLAIIIACIGLFGLSSFIAEQRTKEIAIRKVLGSKVLGLFILLTRDFTKWILIANLFAWPVAYYVMGVYLQGFAYRIDIGLSVFVYAGLMTYSVALFTTGFQSLRSAFANPITALRAE